MKILFLIVSIVVLSFSSIKANDNMLFPQYEEGYAILRGGARAITQFNYDVVEQRMLFIDAGGRSMILPPEDVVVVVIGERLFVPAESSDAFNERISVGDKVYFMRHRAQVHTGGATVYGTHVETRRVNMTTGVNPHQAQGTFGANAAIHDFNPTHRGRAANVFLSDESAIFIHNGSRFVEINSLRSLTRQFIAHRNQIQDFARRNRTDFRNVEDVKAITVYALSL